MTAGSGRRFVYALLVVCGQLHPARMSYCDEAKAGDLQEGLLGETGVFPWLGVLRVHLHEGDSLKIALTGLVLVKAKYAIANADDIARIPRGVFIEDSKAMFVPKSGEPWYSRVKDYLTHPEYDYATVNTIALVELALEDNTAPFLPICWPKYSYNTSHLLYAIGFTDENKLLEKEIYKLQYIKRKNCVEFYERSGLTGGSRQPAHFQCAFAEHAQKECVWENGFVVASNASGYWTIVGLGLHGPGCAAPSRFVDMVAYMQWVQSATDLEEISDYRRASGLSFRSKDRKKEHLEDLQEIPIHETFFPKAEDNSSNVVYDRDFIADPYHINVEHMRYFKIDRVARDAININIFNEKYEAAPRACDVSKTLVYRDQTRIVANESLGQAAYKLTLYDMHLMGYTCIKVKVKCKYRSKALLWWMTSFDNHEGTSITDTGETPQSLLKYIPVNPRLAPEESTTESNFPGSHLKPQHLVDQADYSGITNMNLLLKFTFKKEAVLNVYVYGPIDPPFGYTTAEPPVTEKTTPIDIDFDNIDAVIGFTSAKSNDAVTEDSNDNESKSKDQDASGNHESSTTVEMLSTTNSAVIASRQDKSFVYSSKISNQDSLIASISTTLAATENQDATTITTRTVDKQNETLMFPKAFSIDTTEFLDFEMNTNSTIDSKTEDAIKEYTSTMGMEQNEILLTTNKPSSTATAKVEDTYFDHDQNRGPIDEFVVQPLKRRPTLNPNYRKYATAKHGLRNINKYQRAMQRKTERRIMERANAQLKSQDRLLEI